jgi:hypothetical protein
VGWHGDGNDWSMRASPRDTHKPIRLRASVECDAARFRAVIIVGNLHRLEHWPDDRLMQFETLRNIADLERALQLSPDE